MKKISYGLIPIAIVLALTVICLFINTLFNYHKPINSDDPELMQLIVNQHGHSAIVNNVILHRDIIYTQFSDSIINSSEQINSFDDIILYTGSIDYTIIRQDSTQENWCTIFEVEKDFLRENVGKHLVTFQK